MIYSIIVFVYFLNNKSEALCKFIEFKQFIENQTGQKIKMIRIDNGGEFVNSKI